jgi:hypothetical protein
MPRVVQVYEDPWKRKELFLRGSYGGWRVRLKEHYGLCHVGKTKEEAIEAFLRMMGQRGELEDPSAYDFQDWDIKDISHQHESEVLR